MGKNSTFYQSKMMVPQMRGASPQVATVGQRGLRVSREVITPNTLNISRNAAGNNQ